MNLRSVFFSGVILLSLTVTFGVKSNAKRIGPASALIGNTCINVSATNETYCFETGTGPQCTALGSYPAYKFEATTTPSCSIPLRQPF